VREGAGDALGTGAFCHRSLDCRAKSWRIQALVVQAHACVVSLDASGDIELVA
jgi:hypothetical protein